jgi:gas vesicle protein
MGNNLYLIVGMFLGVSGFIMFLFFYMIKRDREVDKKIAALELMIEEMNQEIFALKKEAKNSRHLEMLRELEEVVEELVDNVKEMERNNLEYIKKLENEIHELEHKTKPKFMDFTNLSKSDEQKIISLYKSGYTIEQISKELRIPAGEVDLAIKSYDFLP